MLAWKSEDESESTSVELKSKIQKAITEARSESTTKGLFPRNDQRSTEALPVGSCNYMTMSDDGSDTNLGSAMFRYASLYGISKVNRKSPVLQPSFSLYNCFDLSIPTEKYPLTNFKNLPENEGCCSYQTPRAQCSENITLNGYRRSWRYFHSYRDEIKKEFKFAPQIHDRCVGNLTEILNEFQIDTSKCILIGVHVQIGPFKPSPNENKTIYEFDTAAYLKKAMKYFRTEWRNDFSCDAYVIIGNDYEWILKVFMEEKDTLFQGSSQGTIVAIHKTHDPIVDMCILAQMNQTIFTFGTFGWWVAYLTGGLVTYQKEYADLLSTHKEYKKNDYFLPEWIAL